MLGTGQQEVYDLARWVPALCVHIPVHWVPAFLIAPPCTLGSGIPHCTSLYTGFRHSLPE